MNGVSMGIDLGAVAELGTRVGTTNALGCGQGMSGMADDPVFEFTIAIVVLTTGLSGD
jgi:hypothetical protein